MRTSGIVNEQYNIEGTPFEMYDVGGQVRHRCVTRCTDHRIAMLQERSSKNLSSRLLLFVCPQRNERKKWINCFDNVSNGLFCLQLPLDFVFC